MIFNKANRQRAKDFVNISLRAFICTKNAKLNSLLEAKNRMQTPKKTAYIKSGINEMLCRELSSFLKGHLQGLH